MPRNFRKRRKRCSDEDDEDEYDVGDVRRDGHRIYFYADVSMRTALKLIMMMDEVVKSRSPIVELHIVSYGGSFDAAIAVVNKIRSIQHAGVRVVTIVDSVAASAATMISVVADERRMYALGNMRIHQISYGVVGKAEEIKDEQRNGALSSSQMIDIYERHTKMKRKMIRKILKREKDLHADECLRRGLVDVVL